MATALKKAGFECFVYAPRCAGEVRRVRGIPVVVSLWVAKYCDVVYTYAANEPQQKLGNYLASLHERPGYLHFPCSTFPRGQELTMIADKVIAKTCTDLEVVEKVCGCSDKAIRIVHASHESRRGQLGVFRQKYKITEDYIVWVGGWLPAKGVRNLSERFARFRARHPNTALKLVMFGGYGDAEYPVPHPDIIKIDKNSQDVPSAIADCLCLAFNSPPAPVGFDANPTILFETMMNRKTFIAQAGTPVLKDIGKLGLVVETDEEWVGAIEQLVFNPQRREQLEEACYRAYQTTYNYARMIAEVENAIQSVLPQRCNKRISGV